jgi:hypothetical protein
MHIVPSLHHRKEGWPSDLMKYCAASVKREDGVVFREEQKENHPVCVDAVAKRHFFDDAATPPCSDARRGL